MTGRLANISQRHGTTRRAKRRPVGPGDQAQSWQDRPVEVVPTARVTTGAEMTLPAVRRRSLLAATVVAGGAIGLLVVHEGTPGWQVVRLAAVATITGLVIASWRGPTTGRADVWWRPQVAWSSLSRWGSCHSW